MAWSTSRIPYSCVSDALAQYVRPIPEGDAMHICEALEQFVLQLEANGRSVHTIGQYRRHIASFAAWLRPDEDLRWVDHQTIARFLSSPEARTRPDGRPRKTCVVNALRGSLKNFFGYLACAGLIDRDPARLVRRARCGPPPPRTLSEDDQKRLLFVLAQAHDPEGRRDHVLFTTMLKTGIRVGSAVALDVGDLERGELRLRTTKGDRPERAFLPRDVAVLLREYLGGRTSGPLFPGRRGERLTTRHVGRRLKAWLGFFNGADEYDDTRTHNSVNELTGRDTDSSGV